MPIDCATAIRNHEHTPTPQACKRGEQVVTCMVKNSTKPVYMCGPMGSETRQHCHPPASTNKATNVRK